MTRSTPSEPRQRVSTQTAGQILKDEWELALKQGGQLTDEAKSRLDSFLLEIQPDIEEALIIGDEMTLSFIRDRVAGRLARITLATIQSSRELLMDKFVTVVRVLMKIGVGALVAV